MNIRKTITFLAALLLASSCFAQSPTQSKPIVSSTLSITGTTGTTIPLNSLTTNTNAQYIITGADILVVSSSGVTLAPVVTLVTGTNNGASLALTGTGTSLLTGTAANYVTHLTAAYPELTLSGTPVSLYIAKSGTASVLNVQVELEAYPSLYP